MNKSTLVPREDMSDLDWLARNVHKFGNCCKFIRLERNGNSNQNAWQAIMVHQRQKIDVTWFTKDQWLARRAELQNKPSWEDAPGWAMWISQDSDGNWWMYETEPKSILDMRGTSHWSCSDGSCESLLRFSGEVIGDYIDTLERRPESSAMPSHGNQPKPSSDIPECEEVKQFEPFVSVEDIGTVSETVGQQYRREIGEIAVNKYNDAMKDAATAKQPAPKGSGNPILGMVLADLTNRALEGKEKYGEPLLAHNGRNPLWDAYQEALDLAMYLRQAIEEQK